MTQLKPIIAFTVMAAATTATAETARLCDPGFCESLENTKEVCAARQEALVPLVIDSKNSCMCDCAAILVNSSDTLSLVGQTRTVKVLPNIKVEASYSLRNGFEKVTEPYKYAAPAGWVITDAVFEEIYKNGDAGVMYLKKDQHGFDLLSLAELKQAYNAAIAYLNQQGLREYQRNRITSRLVKKRNVHEKALFKANIGFSGVRYAVSAQGSGYYRWQPAEIHGYLKVTEQYVGNDPRSLQTALMRYVDEEVAALR
jgi:hypothetical protein